MKNQLELCTNTVWIVRKSDTAISLFALLMILLLVAAGISIGSAYHSKSEFEERTLKVEEGYMRSYYIPPKGFADTIRSDKYLDTGDNVLTDVLRMDTGGHLYGVWVVVISDSLFQDEDRTFTGA